MMPALLLLALAQTYDPASQWPGQPNVRPRVFRSDGPERTTRSGGGDKPTLCDAVTAGDKSGAWECLKGDGTMLVGSATTWTGVGSPTNSVEGGYPVRTYVAATSQDIQPANAAFPASDFSVCQHVRFANTNVHVTLAFGINGSGPASYVFIANMPAGIGAVDLTISDGVGATTTSPAFAFSAGTWYLMCVTYQRVGGAANNVITLYVNGSSVGSSSAAALAQALSSRWATNGYGANVANGGSKSMRGTFVTYKLLTGPDISRIYTAISP